MQEILSMESCKTTTIVLLNDGTSDLKHGTTKVLKCTSPRKFLTKIKHLVFLPCLCTTSTVHSVLITSDIEHSDLLN